jgi:pilus assembly protein Flp/PilA
MMSQFYLYLVNLFRREEGQDLAEYAILLGLIALVVVVAVVLLGTNISSLFQRIAASVETWPIAGGS